MFATPNCLLLHIDLIGAVDDKAYRKRKRVHLPKFSRLTLESQELNHHGHST